MSFAGWSALLYAPQLSHIKDIESPAGTWRKCLPPIRQGTSYTLAALHAFASVQLHLTCFAHTQISQLAII